MKLIFCADKHQGFVQGDTIISDGNGKACLKLLKTKILQYLTNLVPSASFHHKRKAKKGIGLYICNSSREK